MEETKLIGRKIVVKATKDIRVKNFIRPGSTGYVIDQRPDGILYTAFNESPLGVPIDNLNWFVDTANVDVIPSEVDGLRVVHMKEDLTDDDGIILAKGSIGFLIDSDDVEAIAVFPKQSGRRNAGQVVGDDGSIVHYIKVEMLKFA